MRNIKYVVGVLKTNDESEEIKVSDMKVINDTNKLGMDYVIKMYKLLTGHLTIQYPIQVIACIENGNVDIFDDSQYYVDNDPCLRDFILELV